MLDLTELRKLLKDTEPNSRGVALSWLEPCIEEIERLRLENESLHSTMKESLNMARLLIEGGEEIEKLRTELAKAREALKIYASYTNWASDGMFSECDAPQAFAIEAIRSIEESGVLK